MVNVYHQIKRAVFIFVPPLSVGVPEGRTQVGHGQTGHRRGRQGDGRGSQDKARNFHKLSLLIWMVLVYTISGKITIRILEAADKKLTLTNRLVLHILFRTKARTGSSTPPPPFQRAAVLVRGRNGSRAKSSPSPGFEWTVGTGGPSRYRGNERPPKRGNSGGTADLMSSP